MKLFVGNLSWNATEDALKVLFEAVGKVESVKIITDQQTGRSKGFGFVEMANEEDGNAAVTQLNDSPFLNRPLRVSAARQEQSGPRQGGAGRSGYGSRESSGYGSRESSGFGSRGNGGGQDASGRRPYRQFRESRDS